MYLALLDDTLFYSENRFGGAFSSFTTNIKHNQQQYGMRVMEERKYEWLNCWVIMMLHERVSEWVSVMKKGREGARSSIYFLIR